MLDIRRLRVEPDAVRAALARRDSELPAAIDRVLERDTARRDALTRVNDLKAQRNEASKRVGELKRAGESAEELIASTKALGEEISRLDEVPVPVGGEEAGLVLSESGPEVETGFEALLGVLDLAAGARISGSGFPVLRGLGARLQRSLIDWFLDVHTSEHGYTELRVPYLVTRETMTGTGQLPKFADDSYQTERDDLWLIPTAEVPVTNLHRDELLAGAAAGPLHGLLAVLPPRGGRGGEGHAGAPARPPVRQGRAGALRAARAQPDALEELTAEAETLLERLGLPYRRVHARGGRLGFGAAMTYDLEVWAPGVREVARGVELLHLHRLPGAPRQPALPAGQAEKPEFVHTLNGSALALPRCSPRCSRRSSRGWERLASGAAPPVRWDRPARP
jgi:seryl-tRNA synthetase